MNSKLHIVLLLAVVLYMILLVYLLKRKRLLLKYSLLWIFAGLVMFFLAAFPTLLDGISNLIGIYSPVNALFAIILFCIIIILVSVTAIASSLNEKTKRLIQHQAILESRLRELESKAESEK